VRTVKQVLIVGLGTIAQVHLEALGRRSDVEVVGGVDPRLPEAPFPVFGSVGAALASGLAPDLVVVATPTSSHVEVVQEVLATCDALVLSEKPLAATTAELDALASADDRIRVAHHFAFSPEVEWAVRRVAASGWGRPGRILSFFNDAYAGLPPERLASYTSSWIDSGPNQLSLLAPFVGRLEVRSHSDEAHRSVTVLEHADGTAVLSSSWVAADSSKQTVLEFDGRQVRLDHTSMTAAVLEGGVVTEQVGYAGGLGRKLAHYAGLYDALLSADTDVRLGVELATGIARILQDAARAPRGTTAFTVLG
jgi:predicted dehydrogenase